MERDPRAREEAPEVVYDTIHHLNAAVSYLARAFDEKDFTTAFDLAADLDEAEPDDRNLNNPLLAFQERLGPLIQGGGGTQAAIAKPCVSRTKVSRSSPRMQI